MLLRFVFHRLPPLSTLFPYTTLFRSHVSPPVGSAGGNSHLFGFQHEVRFADGPLVGLVETEGRRHVGRDRKSTRLNSSHANISYAVFCLKKKKQEVERDDRPVGGRKS